MAIAVAVLWRGFNAGQRVLTGVGGTSLETAPCRGACACLCIPAPGPSTKRAQGPWMAPQQPLSVPWQGGASRRASLSGYSPQGTRWPDHPPSPDSPGMTAAASCCRGALGHECSWACLPKVQMWPFKNCFVCKQSKRCKRWAGKHVVGFCVLVLLSSCSCVSFSGSVCGTVASKWAKVK